MDSIDDFVVEDDVNIYEEDGAGNVHTVLEDHEHVRLLKEPAVKKFYDELEQYVQQSIYVQLILTKLAFRDNVILPEYRYIPDRNLYVKMGKQSVTLSKLDIYQHARHQFIVLNKIPFFYTRKDAEPAFFDKFEKIMNESKTKIPKTPEEKLIAKALENNLMYLKHQLDAAKGVQRELDDYEITQLMTYKNYTPLEMAARYVADVKDLNAIAKNFPDMVKENSKKTWQQFYLEAVVHITKTTRLWLRKYFPAKMPAYFEKMVMNVENGKAPYTGLEGQKKLDDSQIGEFFALQKNPDRRLSDQSDQVFEESEAEEEPASGLSSEPEDEEEPAPLEVIYVPRLPPGPRQLKDDFGNYIVLTKTKKQRMAKKSAVKSPRSSASIVLTLPPTRSTSSKKSRDDGDSGVITSAADDSMSIHLKSLRSTSGSLGRKSGINDKTGAASRKSHHNSVTCDLRGFEENKTDNRLQFSCDHCVYKKTGGGGAPDEYYIHGRAVKLPSRSSSSSSSSGAVAKNTIYIPPRDKKLVKSLKRKKKQERKRKEDDKGTVTNNALLPLKKHSKKKKKEKAATTTTAATAAVVNTSAIRSVSTTSPYRKVRDECFDKLEKYKNAPSEAGLADLRMNCAYNKKKGITFPIYELATPLPNQTDPRFKNLIYLKPKPKK